MPQIEQLASTYASQAFWLLIVFGLLYFVIARGMLPKVGRVIESRQARITSDLAAAQAAREQAVAAQAAWEASLARAHEQARVTLADLAGKAQADQQARLAAADAELGIKLSKAEQELAQARATALAEIDTVAAQAAAQIVERLTGQQTSVDAARSVLAR